MALEVLKGGPQYQIITENARALLEKRYGVFVPERVAASLSDAKRSSNGFMQLLGKRKLPTGEWEHTPAREFVEAANEDPRAKDHAFEHGVYVRRIVIGEVCRVSELQDPAALEVAVEAAVLAARAHDLVQVFDIHRKLNGAEVEDPKFGHEIGIAALLVSSAQLYAKARKGNGIPTDADIAHAERVVFAAATMVMNHERHDIFPQQLQAQEKAFDLMENERDRSQKIKQFKPVTDEFLEQVENGQIDVYSLSRAQILGLFRLKREKGGYLSAESVYGLPSQIESVYSKELAEAASDANRSLEDVFDFGGRDDRGKFDLAAEAFMRADIRAMFAPWDATFSRTLLVARSRKRQYLPEEFDEEQAFRDIKFSKGHFNNDAQRMLWELMQDTNPGSTIEQNKDYAVDTQRMKLAKAYAVLMLGEHILYGEYDKAIDPIYIRRISRVTEKALSAIHPNFDIEKFRQTCLPLPGQSVEDYKRGLESIVKSSAQEQFSRTQDTRFLTLIDKYDQVAASLVEERNALVTEILPNKPDNLRHSPRPADGSDRPDVATFKRLVNRVIAELSDKLTPEQIHECEDVVRLGKALPSILGKTTVDSLPRHPLPTWFEDLSKEFVA